MDFNLILLLAGLGLLVVVLLFALWGFLGGLKRELTCVAVFLVLLVLTWLVFGDSATLLNAKVGQQVAEILNIQDGTISTLWDAILAYARTQVPNGEALLVEGKETYALFYSVVSAVCHAIGLIVGTIAVLVITPIIRLITHIIWLIVRTVKKKKAKKNAAVAVNEEALNEQKRDDKDAVVVTSRLDGEDAIITKEENVLVKKPSRRRLWGALVGALKGVFVVILLCTPLSGLSSILNAATPETQQLLNDLVNGDAKFEVSTSSTDPIEMVFDFAEEYENSALGKFANGSRFFFGQSFSEQLFDSLLKMETKNQTIYLSEEITTFIKAVNHLEGNVDFTKMNRDQFRNVLENLKHSKMVAEVMPIVIEYAYELDNIQNILVESGTTSAFLDLRYVNWKDDVSFVLDAIKETYDLNLFPLKDFNYLTMNTKELNDVLSLLGETEFIAEGLPTGLKILLNLDVIKNQIGKINIPNLDDLDVKKELNTLVLIYDQFKDFEIESLDGFDVNNFLKDVLNDEGKTTLLFDMIDKVLDLQIVNKIAIPAISSFARTNDKVASLIEDANQMDNLNNLENIMTLDDLGIYIETIKLALDLVDLKNFPSVEVDYFHFDADLLDEILLKLFSSEATNQLVNIGVNVALATNTVKNAVQDAFEGVNFDDVDWESDLRLFVEIYREFLKLGFESTDDFAGDKVDLLQTILDDETKYNATLAILLKLVDAQVFDLAGTPAIQYFLDDFIDKNYQEFSNIIGVEDLTSDEWKEDFTTILDSAQIVNELNVLDNLNPFDYTNFDITSNAGIANIKKLINNIFALNILGNDELKTKLLIASINKFDWTILPQDFKTDTITWDNEKEVLLQLVDIYKEVNDLEEFDILDLASINWVNLLENNTFLDLVVDALEVVIDSNLVLEILPGTLDKYVLPRLDDIQNVDDETLFSDILDKLPSEELVNEIIKLIDVVRAAIDINLLGAKDGLAQIDLANTEALKTIVSGILDSALIQGFEGRIIRIILKATNILDIPKDSAVYEQLVSIDYSGEKDVLVAFIDAIEPVLKDSEFKLTNDEGKFNLDLTFWAENKNASILLDGIQILFGSYPENDVTGSALIEALLPSIYDKFVEDKNLIPDDFKEIVETLDVTNVSGEVLVKDIRRLIFIAEQLIAMDAQTLLNNGDMYISTPDAVTAINSILDALHDMDLFKGHESETLAWGVNYLATKLNIALDEVTTEFNDVNWLAQNEVYKSIVEDIATLLRNNEILTYNELLDFIKNKEFNTTEFINNDNVNALLDILDQIVDVEVIDAIVPLAVKYGITLVDDKTGINASYINEFTSEELNHDFHKLVEIAHKLVDELDFVNYYVNKFDGDLALPNEEVVKSLVDDIFELNIIMNANGKLATLIYNEIVERVVPADQTLIIAAEDFAFETIDWMSEKEILKELLGVGYDFLEANNLVNMADVQSFVKDKLYNSKALLRDENGYVLADAIRVLQNSQLLGNVIEKLYNYGIYFANSGQINLPIPIDYLMDMPKEKLMEDMGAIADILDKAVEFGAMEYLASNDIRDLQLEYAAQIIENVYTLNIVKDHDTELLGNIYNYLLVTLENKTNGKFVLTQTQIEQINCEQELVALANVVRSLQVVLDASNMKSLGDVLNFVSNKTYNQKGFYSQDVYNAIIDAVNYATDLQLLEILTPQIINHVKVFAEQKNIDLSFLEINEYTGKLFVEDIKVLLEIAKIGYDIGAIDLAFDHTLYTIETEVLCEMLDLVPSLNIANLYLKEFLYLGVNFGLDKAKVNIDVTKEDFAEVVLANEIDALKGVIRATKELFDEKGIISLDDVKSFVNNKEYNNEAFFDVATGSILEKILMATADVETVKVLLPKVLNLAVDKITRYDLSFLKDAFTKDELAEDVKTFAQIIVPAINADLVGLAFGAKVNDLVFTFDIYNEMLEIVKDANLLNKKYPEIANLVVNEGFRLANIDIPTVVSDFEGITFANEVPALQSVLDSLAMLTEVKGYVTVGDISNAMSDKGYLTVTFYDTQLGSALESLLTNAADVETVKVLLPKALSFGVDKLNFADFNFLKDAFTKDELAADMKTFAKAINPLIEAEAPKMVFKGYLDEVELQYELYKEILDLVKDANLLNKEYDKLVTAITNFALNKLNSVQTVDADAFAGITFANDVPALQALLDDMAVLTNDLAINTIADVLDTYEDIIKNKQYKDVKYTNRETVNKVFDLVEGALDVATVEAVLPAVTLHGAQYLNEKGVIDVRFLFEDVVKDALSQDVMSLLDTLRELVDYGMIEFALRDGAIDIENVEPINNAIDTMINLNIVNGKEEKTVFAILNKVGIDTTGVSLADVNWQEESATLQNIVNEAKDLLVLDEANTLAKIKGYDFNKFKIISTETNNYIDMFVEIIDALAADQLVERLVLNVSKKYLAKVDSKYNGLVDIYNIYNNGSEFSADLASLADILLEIKNLDVYSFLALGVEYPFGALDTINSLIELVFNLNYLNTNADRIDVIVKAIDPLVSYDLSAIDAKGIDLRADTDKAIEMYSYLANILTHEKWPIKTQDDMNNIKNVKFEKDFLLSSSVWENGVEAIAKFMETTVYDATGAGILFVALPLVKQVAPTYYDTLQLDNVTVEMLDNDLDLVEVLVSDLVKLDFVDLAKNKEYFTVYTKAVLVDAINLLGQSLILENTINDLFELVVNNYVNGKTISNITIPEGTIKAEGIDFKADVEAYTGLVEEVFAILENENLKTVDEVKDFINTLRQRSEFVDFASKDSTWESLANITYYLANLTMVEVNGLAITNNIISPKLTGNLATYFDFTAYNNEEFMYDVNALATVVEQLKTFGLASVMRDENINYDQAQLVKDMLNTIASANYFKYNLDKVIDFVDSKVSQIDLGLLKTTEFDFQGDMVFMGNAYEALIPFLTASNNPFKSRTDIEEFIQSGYKLDSNMKQAISDSQYAFVNAYDELVQMTALPILFDELFNFATSKLPTQYQDIANALKVDELTLAQKKEDILQSALVVRLLADIGIIRIIDEKNYDYSGMTVTTVNNTTTDIEKIDLIVNIIDAIYELNMVQDNSELVLSVLDFAKIDTTNIDFSSVDWYYEKEQLKVIVANTLKAALDYDINTLREIKDYVNDFVKMSLTDMSNEAKNIYNTIDLERAVLVVEALDNSVAFDQMFKPVYEKYLLDRIPTDYSEFADLTDYTVDNLNEDMHYIAVTTRALYDIKLLPETIKENYNTPECQAYAAEAIRAFFSLNYLQQKLPAIVKLGNKVQSSFDTSTIDVSGINLKADGEILAQYAKEMLTIQALTNYLVLDFTCFGNEELMSAVINLYNGMIETSSFVAVSNWAVDQAIDKYLDDSYYARFDETRVYTLSVKFGETLEAMLDTGFFSNDVVDFTDRTNTDRLFVLLTDVFTPTENMQKLIDKFKANLYELGQVKLSYDNIPTKEEIYDIRAAIQEMLNFVKNYQAEFKGNDLSALGDSAVQAAIQVCVEKAMKISAVSQLAMPILNGIVTILTKDIYQLNILEGVDNNQFVNVFLPDTFAVLNALSDLGVFNKNIQFGNTDAILALADAIIHSDSFAEHTDDIFKFTLLFAGIDVQDTDFSDVDWDKEYQGLEGALDELKDALADLVTSDKNTYMNNTFFSALANATPYFEDSKLLPLIGRQVIEYVTNKVSDGKYDVYINRLFDTHYTDDNLVNDYALIDDILRLVVASNHLNGGITEDNFGIAVELIDIILHLEFANGIEDKIIEDCMSQVVLFKDYVFDFTTITDWSVEKEALITALYALVDFTNMDNVDLEHITPEIMQDESVQNQLIVVVDAMSKSIVGQQLLPQIYGEYIENNLGDEYEGIIDFDDPEFTPDMWASEFEKLFNGYNILVNNGFGSPEGLTLTINENIELMTILFGERDNSEAGVFAIVKNPETWVKKLTNNNVVEITNGAFFNMESNRDWLEEAYAITDVLTEMKYFTNAAEEFDFNLVYNTTDANALANLLLASKNCVALRGSILQIIVNTMAENPNMQEQLELAGVIDSQFFEEYNKYEADANYYNPEYLTDERITFIAEAIAYINANA